MLSSNRHRQTNTRTMTSSAAAVLLLLVFLQVTAQCIGAAAGTADRGTLQAVDTASERLRITRVERSAGSSELSDTPDARDRRKWQKNTVRVWGKRDQDGLDAVGKTSDDAGIVENEDDAGTAKRSWSPRNKVRVWGKRSEELDNFDQGNQLGRPITGIEAGEAELNMEEKRKWADNRVKVWGKRSESSTQPFLWNGSKTDRQNPPTGSDVKNGENSIDLDELIKQRVSVVKRAIDDSVASDMGAHSAGGRYVWVSDDDIWAIDAARSLPIKQPSNAEKRASSGYSGAMSTGGGRYWRADGAGPKRSWRTNVIRVWG